MFRTYGLNTATYQVKNVQIYFQKKLDASLLESKENFENTWKEMHSQEISISASSSNFANFSISTKEESATGWVYGLDFKDLKPLPREVHNVTQGTYLGYRWQGVVSEATIAMQYDKSAIPAGYSAKDVKIYYFDATTRHWSPLPEIDHDYSTGTITAQMLANDSGETDYINGVITQPEHPEVAAFTPTQMSDMEYANPAEGVVSIAPPTANSRGVASTSFPLKLPTGRNGMQPSLSIDYSSEASNGWLGKGWDLSFSSISVDTKWGVPEYHSTKETEVYTLDGQELVLKNGSEYTNAHREEGITRATNRIFYLRKEGAYLKIKRYGDNPSNYWWSVTDTQGYTSYYGGVTALQRNNVLSKTLNGGAIAQWALVRTEDPYGNYVDYTYTKRNFTLSPGVTAQEFYPNKVTYTRHSAASNYYEVTFIRDGRTAPQNQSYPLRKDITTSGRFGFLTVTSSLLGEIQIQYVKGSTKQAIRYYTLDYKEDNYGHNLLTKISEYDSDKNLFYNNTMEYYNEIGTGSTSTIESDSEIWDIDEKSLKTPLHFLATPALRSLMSSGSSLGASESTGFSVAGRVGVGIGKIPKNINNTVGFGMNYAQNTQETRISFIDINGDGLPDKIYSSSSGVYYRPNTGNGFGNLQPISGINSLSKTKTRSNSKFADANAFGMISIGYSDNKSKSTTDYYFTDFNGDGLPDLVSNYGVRFNVTTNSGDYTMREFVTNDSDRTENPIEPGEISSDILDDIHFETLDELRSLFPQYDHVKMWTAPYNGTVSVTSIAKLLTLNDCDFSNTFKLTLEKYSPSSTNERATLLHTSSLLTLGQQRSFNRTSIPVQKGEVLFFRIHNVEYGCGGEVEWNPKITYTSISNIPNTVDENGLALRQYDAAQDFVLNNGGNWSPNEEATSVNVNFDLNNGRFNSISITDDIRFKMEKIRINNNTGESQVIQTFTRTYNHKNKTFSGTGNVLTNSINTTNTN